MRRRIWVCMTQLDTLTSYQLGLPPMIQESHCDTQLPRNLLDDDFGPDSTVLPPPRPNTEVTPILFTITKAQLSLAFRAIYNQVSLGRVESYDEVMALDRRLHNARDSISPRFRMTTIQDSVTVSPFLLIRRYGLELFFQKARCILHRHHMAKSYQDPRYSFSRSSCVDAAMAILTHQASILKEVQIGGLLHRNRWLVTSLEQTDFLLASMVICLELSFRAREQTNPGLQSDEKSSREDLMKALESSQLYLRDLKESSSECKQAFDVLSVMLINLSGSTGTQAGQPDTGTVRSSEKGW